MWAELLPAVVTSVYFYALASHGDLAGRHESVARPTTSIELHEKSLGVTSVTAVMVTKN